MVPALRRCALLMLVLGGQALALPQPVGIMAPKGESTVAYDINAAGEVAAVLEDEQGNQRAVLYENGRQYEIGSPGGKFSDAKGINDNGEVVGSARNKNGTWSAFVFNRTDGMRALGTLGGPSSYGMSINQKGESAGFADIENGDWHAFVHDGAAMKDLGTLGGKTSYAAGINIHGQVVGTASNAREFRHAFRYDPVDGMVDLGTLGGRISSATAINDHGMVVGASETADRKWHAFVHDGKRMIDLGVHLPGNSYATDINNAGHVVGTVLVNQTRGSFVWRDGKMTIHGGVYGLHLTHGINEAELVIGAIHAGNNKMQAATMWSNAKAIIAPTADERFLGLGLVLAGMLAGAAALSVLRKRYEGLILRSFSSR